MKRELLTYKDPKSPVSEIFRTLRTNIQFMNTNRKLKTLLVTSTFPEEGKSWVTSNLAVTFAQAGKRVILVDADMRKGRQYNIFGVLPKPGLSNYLSNMDAENNETNDVSIANYIQATDVENLHIITAGNVPPNPSELLVSHRMKNLLQELKNMCDLVIIDGTPCDLVTDAVILSRIVDSTIIVTAQKQTKKDNLTRIVKNIQNVGGRIAGVVLNKVDMSTKKYNQAYYYGSISGSNLPAKTKKRKKENSVMDGFITNIFKNSSEEKEIKEESNYNENLDKEEKINDSNDTIVENIESNLQNEKYSVEENKENINEYDAKDLYKEYKQYQNEQPVEQYQSEQPVEQYNNEQPVEQYQNEQPVEQYQSEQPVEQYNNEQPVEQYQSEQPVEQYQSEQPVEQYQSEQPVEQYYNEQPVEQYQNEKTNNEYKSEIEKNEIIPNINEQLKENNNEDIYEQDREEYRRINEQINNNNKNFKKNKKKNRNKKFHKQFNQFKNTYPNFNDENKYDKNLHKDVVNGYKEVEAKIEEEGKISEVKIEQNMDEKTKEILRQVNAYIEAEKNRQGEKY